MNPVTLMSDYRGDLINNTVFVRSAGRPSSAGCRYVSSNVCVCVCVCVCVREDGQPTDRRMDGW